ncbi:ATP-binding protein [Streptomyces sp. NPDC002143]
MIDVTLHGGALPASFSTFVGRWRDISEVRRLLGAARLLTLTGVGGVGKTRLALETARASRKAFRDGVWLVDLASVRDPATLAATVATALGLPDLGARPVVEQLAGYVAGRRALIVLDNCEHLVEACAELAGTLLSSAADLRILATSRQTLGIVGEHVFTLAPLSIPDEAVELLRDRAIAVRPEFQITEENLGTVTRLCADLDGLPLAIELAASRLRTLTVEQVADRLEDRFALLTGGSRTAQPRQRTLRALIDWSYELCVPAERLLWSRLSVFAGSFGLDAAEGVCAGKGIARHEVLDLLDRLVAQSVVLTTEHEGLPRYRMLETIRQYSRARLTESGDERLLLRRHRDFFLAFAEHIAADWCGPGQEEALARLRAEHANLLAALDFGDDPQATLALATALRFHWCAGGFLGEGRRRLDRALADAPEPTLTRAGALWAAAWVALLQGDLAPADRWLDEAGALGEQLEDPVVCAYVQGFRGASALYRGQLQEAASLYEGAAVAHAKLGEGTGAIFALYQLTMAQAYLGDPRAAETGRQAVATAEAHGERWGLAHAYWALGHDAWVRGDWEAGIELARAGLEIERGFNDYTGAALMLELLARITASRGDYEQAGRLLGTVRALLRGNSAIISASPATAENRARYEESVVTALGPAAYEKALRDGGHHDSPDRAIAYALGGDPGTAPAAQATATSPLTRREGEVAALVAQGMTNRQIALTLMLSRRTVDGHVENIRAKLNFGSRAQIAAWWTTNQAPTR